MKRKSLILCLLIITVISLCSCGAKNKIVLSANDGTGYNWSCNLSRTDIAEMSSEYKSDNGTAIYTFEFYGLSEGQVIATTTLGNPWQQKTVNDIKRYIITVDNKLKTTVKETETKSENISLPISQNEQWIVSDYDEGIIVFGPDYSSENTCVYTVLGSKEGTYSLSLNKCSNGDSTVITETANYEVIIDNTLGVTLEKQ